MGCKGMTCNNRGGGRCIRCEAWTRSYVGVRVDGKVLCKHCAKVEYDNRSRC